MQAVANLLRADVARKEHRHRLAYLERGPVERGHSEATAHVGAQGVARLHVELVEASGGDPSTGRELVEATQGHHVRRFDEVDLELLGGPATT